MIKQYFTHYENWEDYRQGMYRLTDEKDKDILVFKAVNLLKNQELFYDTMKELVLNWDIATKVNLTNNQQNKRAWLGAAACSYKYNVPEYLTRIAWNLLNKEDQIKANQTAEKIISEYYNRKDYAKTLFEN